MPLERGEGFIARPRCSTLFWLLPAARGMIQSAPVGIMNAWVVISKNLQPLVLNGIIWLSLVGIAIGRFPRFRMNRATIAFAGAALLVAVGGMNVHDALGAIDLETLVLIVSLMIVSANLKLAGFFELSATRLLKAAQTPKMLLALIMATSAVLSALFLNDTVCIMLPPLIATLCLRNKRNPVPYLIALAVSANIGSSSTLIGNPQNMLIGAASGISFLRFTALMSVPAVLGTLAAYGVVILCFRREFCTASLLNSHLPEDGAMPSTALSTQWKADKPPVYKPLLYKSLFAVILMLAALMSRVPVVVAAMSAAAILLITRRIRPERVFAELDWSIIVFFAGLFIITAGVAQTGAFAFFMNRGMPAIGQNMISFSLFTAILSNIVSNVPAVLLLRPAVAWFENQERAWLIMSMASTYAGNLTLLGSVANLIVAESVKPYGIHIGFGAYLKVGLPVTILTIAIGTVWLIWV